MSDEDFTVLYIVLIFPQFFEGLTLGSRPPSIEWQQGKRWTPYFLGMGYVLSTPSRLLAV